MKAEAEAEAAVKAEAVVAVAPPPLLPVPPPVIKKEQVGDSVIVPMEVDSADAADQRASPKLDGDVAAATAGSTDEMPIEEEGDKEEQSMDGPMPYLEDDERMLAYLHGRHGGDEEVAKLCLLSHLSMGRAVQARRKMRKVRRREEVEGVPLSDMLYPSEVWRRRYERLFNTMAGDMRKRQRTGLYSFNLHYGDGTAVETRRSGVGMDADTIATSASGKRRYDYEEELKKPWRSVLDCAEALVQRVPIQSIEPGSEGNVTVTVPPAIDGPKPTLDELIILLRQAHTLPRPEEIFGKRDTANKRISMCMNTIISLVVKARNRLATLNDLIFDEDGNGIDLDELDNFLGDLEESCPLILNEIPTVRAMLESAQQWEDKANRILAGDLTGMFSLEDYEVNKSDVCVLTAAERLVHEGKVVPLRPQSLVSLKARVEKALVLRERLRQMESEKGDTMKQYSSLVREANRIDLAFPEVSALSTVHQAAEEWTDRATVAMRSRLSLAELEELVDTGNEMPVNLSDLLGKLRARVQEAHEWIEDLKRAVPGSAELAKSSSREFGSDRLEWLHRIRDVFNDEGDGSKELLNLASDGSRIPVDIMELQLLQIETDARNWTIKAKKWTENKGKIEELRDHLARGDAIRSRVKLDKNQRGQWGIDAESELKAIVKSADRWYKKYRGYIEGDRRRNRAACIVSLPLLRLIVDELNEIPANLGNPATKMKRILSQAESWYDENKSLLAKCGVKIEGEQHGDAMVQEGTPSGGNEVTSPSNGGPKIQYEVLQDAVESATEVSLDLEEALALKKLLDDSQEWYDRAMGVAPKRNKRTARGKKKSSVPEKPTLEELLTLVREAPDQLIDTTTALQRLNMQLNDIQSWRLQAQVKLRDIVNALVDLRNERKAHLGAPAELLNNAAILALKEDENDGASDDDENEALKAKVESEEKDAFENSQSMDIATPSKDGSHVASHSNGTESENAAKLGAHRMIANFLKEAQGTAMYTVEEEIAEMLDKVSEWLSKAAGYISHPAKLFVQRNFKELDHFIQDGEYLLRTAESPDLTQEDHIDDMSLLTDINSTWSSLVSDEKTRLEKLRSRRDQFKEWDEKVEEVLEEDDKKYSLDVLRDLLKEGSIYPQGMCCRASLCVRWYLFICEPSLNKVIFYSLRVVLS